MEGSVVRRVFPRILLVALLASGASACATSRGIVDLRPGLGQAPASGPAVAFASIEDKRHFEVAPRDASIPSLKDGRISDAALTSRAIARKRNTYGQALGDILRPEGRTVVDVVGEALSRALHDKGYRVVPASAAAAEGADALQVEILDFWSWITPGFWAMHIESRLMVRVTGTRPPLAGPKVFRGYIRLGTQAATTGAWQNTMRKGIDSFVADVEAQLGVADSSSSSSAAPPPLHSSTSSQVR